MSRSGARTTITVVVSTGLARAWPGLGFISIPSVTYLCLSQCRDQAGFRSSRSCRRSSFPVGSLGSSGTNSIVRGHLKEDSRDRQFASDQAHYEVDLSNYLV